MATTVLESSSVSAFCESVAIMLAAGIQTALWRLAPEYPASLPLVGFDGVSVSEYCRISTVAQPIYQMGEQAVLTLVQLINGEEAPASSILPVRFIRRKSSGPRS